MCECCVHCVYSWLQLCYFCLQACNYWTRAAAFSQCLRQRSTLIGVRKSRKMALSWPTSKKILPPLFLSQTHVESVRERVLVFTSLMTGIPLWSRSSWQSTWQLSKVSSCVIPLLFLRKKKRQRRRFSTNWTFSQCHSALAGDLQEPKQG